MTETLSPAFVPARRSAPTAAKVADRHVPPGWEIPETPAKLGTARALLHAAIVIPLLAIAVLLMVFSLVPAVFVGLLLFLPAVAPLILVGLGVLATGELNLPEEERICDPNQPCCCGLHVDALNGQPG